MESAMNQVRLGTITNMPIWNAVMIIFVLETKSVLLNVLYSSPRLYTFTVA